MIKKLLFVCIALLPSVLFAQVYDESDRAMINSRIDTLIQNYLQKSSLTLPGSNKRNDKVVADLRAMIKTDAEVFDDINASFNEKTHQYELKSKSRNTFIEDIVDKFPKGLVITNKNLNINYSDFDKGEVSFAIARSIQGTSSDKFVLFNDDTLMVTIGILPDKSVKIINISKIGSHIKCLNDDDTDGVIDELDECRNSPGLISLNGCPDDDGDGIPNKKDQCPNEKGPASNGGCPLSTFAYQFVFSGSVGYTFNRNILEESVPVKALSGYNDAEGEGNSKLKNKIQKPNAVGAVQLNANIGYYFGRNKSNKTTGLSLGISYLTYHADYFMGGLKVMYRGTDSKNQNFHQIFTLSNLTKENLNFNIVNVPLLLKYKKKFGFLAVEVGAGPSLLFVHTNSSISGNYDFEAIYENNRDASHPYHVSYAQNASDWLITNDFISHNTGNHHTPKAKDELDNLYAAGYNVGLDQNFGKSNKIKDRIGLSANVIADLFYHITPKTAVKFGGTFTYSKLSNNNSNYIMVSKRDDTTYNSIYNSSIKSTYLAYGFNMGVIIGLNVNRH